MPQLMFANITPDDQVNSHFVALGSDDCPDGQISLVGYLEPGYHIEVGDPQGINEAKVIVKRVVVNDHVADEKVEAYKALRDPNGVTVKEVRRVLGANRDDDILIMMLPDPSLRQHAVAESEAEPAPSALVSTVLNIADMMAAWAVGELTLQYHAEVLHLMDVRPIRVQAPPYEERDFKRMVRALTPMMHRRELAVDNDHHVFIKVSLFGKARVAFGSMHEETIEREYIIPVYALAPRA